MAKVAFSAHSAFVQIIGRVASSADHRCILEFRRLMAGFALAAGMCTDQLESGFVVIVCDTRPLLFIMASLTAVTQLPLMSIVILMTGVAILGCCLTTVPDIKRAFVAALALGVGVRKFQRKFCRFSVIKDRWLPALVVVTAVTRLAVVAVMFIIGTVAFDTSRR